MILETQPRRCRTVIWACQTFHDQLPMSKLYRLVCLSKGSTGNGRPLDSLPPASRRLTSPQHHAGACSGAGGHLLRRPPTSACPPHPSTYGAGFPHLSLGGRPLQSPAVARRQPLAMYQLSPYLQGCVGLACGRHPGSSTSGPGSSATSRPLHR